MLVWVVCNLHDLQLHHIKTAFGRYFYAISGSEKSNTAFRSIDTNKVISLHIQTWALAGLAGLLCAARVGSVNGSTGTSSSEMDAIGSCFIGGASAYGGSGTVGGVVIGALLSVLSAWVCQSWVSVIPGSML